MNIEEQIQKIKESIKEEIDESLAPVSMPAQRLDEFCKRVAYRLIKKMKES